jgi:hypothetical protein
VGNHSFLLERGSMNIVKKITKIIIAIVISTFSFVPFLTVPHAVDSEQILSNAFYSTMIAMGYQDWGETWSEQKENVYEELWNQLSGATRIDLLTSEVDNTVNYLKVNATALKRLIVDISDIFGVYDEVVSYKEGLGIIQATSLSIPILTYTQLGPTVNGGSPAYYIGTADMYKHVWPYNNLYEWIYSGHYWDIERPNGTRTELVYLSSTSVPYLNTTIITNWFGSTHNRWGTRNTMPGTNNTSAYSATIAITMTPSTKFGLDPALGNILSMSFICDMGCYVDDVAYFYTYRHGFIDVYTGIGVIPLRTNLPLSSSPYIAEEHLNYMNDVVRDMWVSFDGIHDWSQYDEYDDIDQLTLEQMGFVFDEEGNVILGGQQYFTNNIYYQVDKETVISPDVDPGDIDWPDDNIPSAFDIPILSDIFGFFVAIYNLIVGFITFMYTTFTTMSVAIGGIITNIFSFIDYMPTQLQSLMTVGMTIFSSLIILGIIRFVIKLGGR